MGYDDLSRLSGSSVTRRSDPVLIPAPLTDQRVDRELYEYVILGAGCSGLTLCLALLDAGVTGPILLLDQRTEYRDDRTWCFWDVESTRFSHLAIARWNSWSVRSGTSIVNSGSNRYDYLCLAARDFYECALTALAQHDNVTLRLGETVSGNHDGGETNIVSTDRVDYRAQQVIDGRGLPVGSARLAAAVAGATWLPQQFLGLRIRAHRPTFDPSECVLMDFDVPQHRGLRFLYVLPVSDTEALIENVYFAEPGMQLAEYEAEIEQYLMDRYHLHPADYLIEGRERGYIPMTDHTFPVRLDARTLAIGMMGGGTRPSTGYTFLRIQRSCSVIARALVSGTEPQATLGGARQRLLDAVFLRFMVDHPERSPSVFLRMFGRTPADPLVRFLSDRSSIADELRLIVALPKGWFLSAAARVLWRRSRARR